MTRALTETDLRVERDRLLEGGRTPEEAERMQRAASPHLERLAAALVREWLGPKEIPRWGDYNITIEIAREMKARLPAAEKSIGVHAPQPFTLGGETNPPRYTHCRACGVALTTSSSDQYTGLCFMPGTPNCSGAQIDWSNAHRAEGVEPTTLLFAPGWVGRIEAWLASRGTPPAHPPGHDTNRTD